MHIWFSNIPTTGKTNAKDRTLAQFAAEPKEKLQQMYYSHPSTINDTCQKASSKQLPSELRITDIGCIHTSY